MATGSLKLYIGCMYASKSTTMLRDLQRYSYARKRCVVIKHACDTRYDSVLSSVAVDSGVVCHDMQVYRIDTIVAARLADAADRIADYDCIGISEVQFYDDALLADEWARTKIVIAEGLDGTYTRENFGQLHMLIPRAERVVKLSAVCIGCGRKAAFTRKIGGDMNAVVDIGGRDKYMPVCRGCYDADLGAIVQK